MRPAFLGCPCDQCDGQHGDGTVGFPRGRHNGFRPWGRVIASTPRHPVAVDCPVLRGPRRDDGVDRPCRPRLAAVGVLF